MSNGKLVLPQLILSSNEFLVGLGGEKNEVELPPTWLYLLEHLVASGAQKIVVCEESFPENTLLSLPELMKKYIEVSSAPSRGRNVANAFFEEILDELEIDHRGNGWFLRGNATRNFFSPAVDAHNCLSLFLGAFYSKAHFHFDINAFVSQLKSTMNELRNPESRAKIAALLNCLNSYEGVALPSLGAIAQHSPRRTELLVELMRSIEFDALSKEHGKLGAIADKTHLLEQINSRVRRVLSLRSAKEIASYSSKAASVAVGAPIPGSALVEKIVGDAFLPPAINLYDEMKVIAARVQRDFPDRKIDWYHEPYDGIFRR
ncbi:hypothetical protein GFB49_17545 [Epibacterium sp. SM1979]|uniref:Uncharacterized protein n=1 Tax=Tritonibacter litoralis TaxID=2662264 RepID=A0A843YKS9_9RHOB|nr:hypothetical protein [Tritonibacter litoralis]MQQ10275.1 hypothetical protein [Tritonibacter litoralis]